MTGRGLELVVYTPPLTDLFLREVAEVRDGPPPATLQPAPAVGDFYLDRLSGQVYELAA